MAQWIPDPQGRTEVEKVSKNLKLPVWQPWYKGKFRDFWNEVWGKIDDSYGLLKTLADGKVSKTGDTMTGQLEIKINPQHTADFLYLYRNNDKIASLGGGADDFFIHNSVANTTLQMKNNGYAFYPALNLETTSKEVVAAINEVLTKTNTAQSTANSKEPMFNKNTGFNKNKSDSINSNSSETLATSKAVKVAYDKGVEALAKANTKENAIVKKSGFNLEKSDSITLDDTNKVATSRAINSLNTKKLDKTGGVVTGDIRIKNNNRATFDIEGVNINGGFGHNFTDCVYLINRISQKQIKLHNNGNAEYPALNLKTTSKEVVGAINEVNSKKIDKTELNKTLINFNQIVSVSSVHNFIQPLSNSMNFINIKIGTSDGNYTQFIKIPMSELRYNVFYLFFGIGQQENAIIKFNNHSKFEYEKRDIIGVSQVDLHKIWQSMI